MHHIHIYRHTYINVYVCILTHTFCTQVYISRCKSFHKQFNRDVTFPITECIAFWLLMSSRAQKLTHGTGRHYFCAMLICGSWHFSEVSHSRKQLWPLGGLRKMKANLTKSSKFVMTHCLTRQCIHHKIHWEGGLAHHFLNLIYELESQSNANQYRELEQL